MQHSSLHARMSDDLLKAKLPSSPHQLALGLTGVLQTKGLIFFQCDKNSFYSMVKVEDLSQKKWHFTPLTNISQATSTGWLNCSALYEPTPRRTHPPFPEAAQQSPILHISEGISTHACWETTLVLAAPQTEPLHNTYLVPQPQYQYPQTPCSCLCLTTEVISSLSRRKWAEKQRPVLVYYSQLNNLPFSKRKTLCRYHSPVFHPPKRHSDLLAHFKKMWQHITVF